MSHEIRVTQWFGDRRLQIVDSLTRWMAQIAVDASVRRARRGEVSRIEIVALSPSGAAYVADLQARAYPYAGPR